MFKNIPGSHGISISLNGELKNSNDVSVVPLVVDGKITLMLNGKKQDVDLKWISRIAHFEVNLPLSHVKFFNSIQFYETNPKVTNSTSGLIMSFPKPLLIGGRYRIIPGFTDYAVSESGEVINIVKWCTVKIQKSAAGDYPCVSIYNPDKSRSMEVKVHRLVALAWVPNSDWKSRCCVNHLDGNKTNCHRTNLEWVSYSENSNHAVNAGLLSCTIPCDVKNIETGEVLRFNSAAKAFEYIGMEPRVLALCTNRGRKPFLNGKFQLKRADDNTPWQTNSKFGQYITTVKYPDGSEKTFHDLRDFRKEMKVWNTSSIHDLLDKARVLYPDHVFTYRENYKVSEVQARNIYTGDVIEAKSCTELSRITGVSKSRIVHYIHVKDDTTICNGYVFRVKSDEIWKSDISFPKNKSSGLIAICTKTSKHIRFESLRKASEYFNIDRSAIKNRIGNPTKLLGCWRFENEPCNHEPITSARV